ncbi:MAG: epoxide hydrolase N-terminal domain-containing protein, partial [Microbacterium sp.]|nr:epoxide hydrolase N-terminal domain-containing protein [Microbacterium sp.]
MNNTTALAIRPFSVSVTDDEVADLQNRLARTRLPQPAPADDWTTGTPNDYLREALAAWRAFDWR